MKSKGPKGKGSLRVTAPDPKGLKGPELAQIDVYPGELAQIKKQTCFPA
ncbi:hypothetical protein ABMH50_003083 [Escherichia albertii]